MALPPVLAAAQKRPGMYLYPTTYWVACAFVSGYDAATQGGLLVGFREWLSLRVTRGYNLGWPGMLLCKLFENDLDTEAALQRPGMEERAIAFMFETLDQFLSEEPLRDRLRRIYVAYDQWQKERGRPE